MRARAHFVGRGGLLAGELLLGGGEEVLELLVPAGRAHPRPAEPVAKLGRSVTLAGVGSAADADGRLGGLCDRRRLRRLELRLAGRELRSLGTDLRGGRRDRGSVADVLGEAALQQGAERADLPPGGEAGAPGGGVAGPCPGGGGGGGLAAPW